MALYENVFIARQDATRRGRHVEVGERHACGVMIGVVSGPPARGRPA